MEKNIKRLGKFYIILTLVLAVAGIIAYVFAKSNTQRAIDSLTTSIPTSYAFREPTQANNEVTGIPDERPAATESPSTTAAVQEDKIERAKEFFLPMGNSILKDYSDGQLVYSETMEDWRAHKGIDFAGDKGSDILSVNNGVVQRVYDSSLYGTVVEIDHGNGLVAKYCPINPDGFVIAEGSKVTAGQKIGTLGVIPIESADEEHLHFEMTQDGKYVDPIKAMGKSREKLS